MMHCHTIAKHKRIYKYVANNSSIDTHTYIHTYKDITHLCHRSWSSVSARSLQAFSPSVSRTPRFSPPLSICASRSPSSSKSPRSASPSCHTNHNEQQDQCNDN